MLPRQTSVLSSGNGREGEEDSPFLPTGLADPNFYLPFFHYLAIPKNTTEADYETYTLPLPIAQIHRLWVEFPKGCAGLVGLQLWRKVEQIFPLPAGIWLRSDGYTFSFNFTHFIDAEPYEVEIRGYNLDDTFQHTIWVGLELRGLPSEIPSNLAAFFETLR